MLTRRVTIQRQKWYVQHQPIEKVRTPTRSPSSKQSKVVIETSQNQKLASNGKISCLPRGYPQIFSNGDFWKQRDSRKNRTPSEIDWPLRQPELKCMIDACLTSTARNTKKIRSKFRIIQFKSALLAQRCHFIKFRLFLSANQKNGSHTRPKRTSDTVRTRLSLLKSIERYRVTTLKTSSSNLAQTSIRMISPSKTCSIRNLTQVWSSRRLSIGKTRISTTVWGSSLIRAKKSSKLVTYPFCSIPWRSKMKS